jgi:hypothetical protein
MARTTSSPYIVKMSDGSFWVEETPVGSVNGSNKTFTLSATPYPLSSIEYEINGQTVLYTTDFTVSGDTLTTVYAYPAGTTHFVRYRCEPV